MIKVTGIIAMCKRDVDGNLDEFIYQHNAVLSGLKGDVIQTLVNSSVLKRIERVAFKHGATSTTASVTNTAFGPDGVSVTASFSASFTAGSNLTVSAVEALGVSGAATTAYLSAAASVALNNGDSFGIQWVVKIQ